LSISINGTWRFLDGAILRALAPPRKFSVKTPDPEEKNDGFTVA